MGYVIGQPWCTCGAGEFQPPEIHRAPCPGARSLDVERPPEFMVMGEYAEMWRAWKRLQSSGAGTERGRGWRVEAFETAEGATMRLEVDFT